MKTKFVLGTVSADILAREVKDLTVNNSIPFIELTPASELQAENIRVHLDLYDSNNDLMYYGYNGVRIYNDRFVIVKNIIAGDENIVFAGTNVCSLTIEVSACYCDTDNSMSISLKNKND